MSYQYFQEFSDEDKKIIKESKLTDEIMNNQFQFENPEIFNFITALFANIIRKENLQDELFKCDDLFSLLKNLFNKKFNYFTEIFNFSKEDDNDIRKINSSKYLILNLIEKFGKLQTFNFQGLEIPTSLNFPLQNYINLYRFSSERFVSRFSSFNEKNDLNDLIYKLLDLKEDSSVLFYDSDNYELLSKISQEGKRKIYIYLNKENLINNYSIYEGSDRKKDFYLNYKNDARMKFLHIIQLLENAKSTCELFYDKSFLEGDKEVLKFQRIFVIPNFSSFSYNESEDIDISRYLCEGGIGIKLLKDSLLNYDCKDTYYYKQYECQKCNLKSIIAVPTRMQYRYQKFGSNKVLMYYEGKVHQNIMFVNASTECHQDSLCAWFDNENIKRIQEYIEKETDGISASISYDKIKENKLSLTPYDYVFTTTIGKCEAKKLSELVINGKGIFRGYDSRKQVILNDSIIQTKDNNLENNKTQHVLVRFNEIENFDSSSSLQVIEKTEDIDNYVLHDGDLLLNKNGLNTRVVMYNEIPGYNLIPDGNIIIVRLDKNKINPMFVKIYLESNIGIKQLQNISQSGVTLRSINISRLGNVPIPVPDIKAQNDFVAKYIEKTEKIKKLNEEILELCNEFF